MRLKTPILIAIILLCAYHSRAQKLSPPKSWLDSISRSIKALQKLESHDSFPIGADSLLKSGFTVSLHLDVPDLQKAQVLSIPQKKIQLPLKPLVEFGGGYLSYNWNYRSSVDTPFQESNLSQHLLSASLNFTLAQRVPVVISFYDRESNSKYFRDYRDFRLEFNAREFHRLQAQKLANYADRLASQLRDPLTKPSLDFANKELEKIEKWKTDRETENKLIRSRATILNGGTIDSATHRIDSASLPAARKFVERYQAILKETKRLQSFRDSVQAEYTRTEKEVQFIKGLISTTGSGFDKKNALAAVLKNHGIEDKRLQRLYSVASSVRTLAVGKTLPNYSELTLKNITVNGINFEYNRRLYFALSAGAVDYRARDFFYSKVKRKPQFIYALRAGYGQRERSHVFLTAFKGKKQTLSSLESPSIDVYGLSFESQVLVNKNTRVLGEIAQSASPALINSSGPSEKSSLNLSDEKSRAYAIKLNSYFPKSRSRFEAFYKYRGINFQNFSSYYTNAALHQWSVRADQFFLKRRVHINASLSKNTYENPYLLTRYSGNTVFKNLTLAFKKPKWPGVTLGYMPSSQLSEVNGQVYENFYQALTLSLNHQYKIGVAQAFTLFSYNRFYNNSTDTGFLYYNASNYYFNQHFQFLSYTADINIAQTKSRDYVLTVLQAGTAATLWKESTLGFGVKINQLNNQSLKVGLYGSEKISIHKLGDINIWIEKSFLPGWKGDLIKTEFYNIGFFRVIK